MSNNIIDIDISELHQALQALPEDLKGEAAHIVEAAVNGATVDIRAAYAQHRFTGKLFKRLSWSTTVGPTGAVGVIKNTSPLAYIFENGTQARHTKLGANRGSMPPGHAFIPPVLRARRRMYEQLKALLVRAGLIVTGDANA